MVLVLFVYPFAWNIQTMEICSAPDGYPVKLNYVSCSMTVILKPFYQIIIRNSIYILLSYVYHTQHGSTIYVYVRTYDIINLDNISFYFQQSLKLIEIESLSDLTKHFQNATLKCAHTPTHRQTHAHAQDIYVHNPNNHFSSASSSTIHFCSNRLLIMPLLSLFRIFKMLQQCEFTQNATRHPFTTSIIYIQNARTQHI